MSYEDFANRPSVEEYNEMSIYKEENGSLRVEMPGYVVIIGKSTTFTNDCADVVRRQDVIDCIHRYWSQELDKLPTEITEDGEMCKGDYNSILTHNKELCRRINMLKGGVNEDD